MVRVRVRVKVTIRGMVRVGVRLWVGELPCAEQLHAIEVAFLAIESSDKVV